LLRKAGVEMTHPEPVEKAFEYMSIIVDMVEGLVE